MRVYITAGQIIEDLNKNELEELKKYISNAERFYKAITEKHPNKKHLNKKDYGKETAEISGLDIKYCLLAWDYLS